MKRFLSWLILLLLLGLLAPAARAQSSAYTVVDCDAGADYATVMSINDAGQLAGFFAGDDEEDHACLWQITGATVRRINQNAYNRASWAYAINNAGQLAGYFNSTSNSGTSRATLFGSDGTGLTPTDAAPAPPTYAYSKLFDLNNAGQGIGRGPTASGMTLFTFGSAGTTYTDLPPFSGNQAWVYALNDAGQVVGQSSLPNTSYIAATLWTTSGGTVARTNLGTLGGDMGCALGLNSTGGVIVGSSNAVVLGTQYATMWTLDGSTITRTNLGALGSRGSRACSVNGAGQVVGLTSLPNTTYDEAFLYTAAGGMQDLAALVPASAGVSGVSNYGSGRFINEWGQIAANAGIGGRSHVIRLDPVAPLTSLSGATRTTRLVDGMNYALTPALTTTTSPVTNLRLRDGQTGSGGAGQYGLNRLVVAAPLAAGSPGLASSTVSLKGTESDLIVVQMDYQEGLATQYFGQSNRVRLGWHDGARWLNAVEGNAGGVARFAGNRAYNADTDRQLGTYGIDTANHVVWAVVNHGGTFGVTLDPDVLRRVKTFSRTGSVARLTVDSFTGHRYQLQRASALTGDNSVFRDVGSPLTGGTGGTLSFTNNDGAANQAFYRIRLDP